jgi:hypothetical protein
LTGRRSAESGPSSRPRPGPGREEPDWCAGFDLLAAQGRTDRLEALLSERHRRCGDGASFAYRHLISLLESGQADRVELLGRALSPESAFAGIFHFIAGLAAAARFDLDATVRRVRDGAYMAAVAAQAVFAADRAFAEATVQRMIQQSCLLEFAAFPAAADFRRPLAGPVPVPDESDPRTLVLACCDRRYFRAYAARFLEQVGRLSGCRAWIHVVNPDAADCRALAGLAGPGRCLTSGAGAEQAAALASLRFQLAAARPLAVPVLLADIDGVFPEGFEALLAAAAAAAPVGYVGVPRAWAPSLVVAAALLCVQPGPVGRRFLQDAAAYLEAKLAEPVPVWTVDQAALFRAVCLARARHDPVVELGSLLPGRFRLPADLTAGHEIAFEERRQQRGVFGEAGYQVVFDADRRPRLSPAR